MPSMLRKVRKVLVLDVVDLICLAALKVSWPKARPGGCGMCA